MPAAAQPPARALGVAHRTPHTAAACARLADAGAHVFELDVELRGGRLVVSHYLPVFGISGWLEHDNARLRWRSGPPRDVRLPDLLARVPATCRILLDPKLREPRQRDDLVEALAAALPERARFVVSTSDPGDLARYRAAGFATWRTLGDDAALARALADGPLADAGYSVRHRLLTSGSVARLRERSDTVVAWTVNRPERALELRGIGVTGITTDRIGVLSALAGVP